jgi:sugar lactone lactonase YvrE
MKMRDVFSVAAGTMTSSEIAELVDIIPAGNTLGEGILWDARGERLWWTDIQERQLLRCTPETHAVERFALPERLGSFGFIEESDNIIAAFESGFALYHPETGQLEWLSRPRHDSPAVRFNDGRVDRQGRFWAGSMVEGGGKPQGKLYCFDGSGEAKIHATEIGISNSLCFSPDGRTLYFADTPLRTIFRFDLDTTTGTISNRRIFAQTPGGAYPDGANVDCEGYVWSAHWGAGRLVRYAPDGTIAAIIDVPATQPTCVAFGGENLDLLFVTSAREGLDDDALRAQPHAGDVFVFKTSVSGLPDRAAQIGRSVA